MALRTVTALFLAGLFLWSASCGSGDEGDTRGTTIKQEIGLPVQVNALTKAEYVARANQRCRKTWAMMAREYSGFLRHQGPADTKQSFSYISKSSFLPHIQFWFDDISYMGAPSGDRVEVEDMLKALQLAVHSGEERRLPTPQVFAAVFGGFNRLARKYGLTGCILDEESFARIGAGPSASTAAR